MLQYKHHPSFAFQQPPLKLDNQLGSSFEKAYRLAEAKGKNMPATFRDELREQCNNMLKKIEENLLSQTAEEREQYFLKDLFNRMKWLLNEDLNFYFRDPHLKKDTTLTGEAFDKMLAMNDNLFFTTKISKDAVTEILSMADDIIEGFRKNAANGRTTREDLSANNGPVIQQVTNIINKEFEKLGVNKVVSVYMGEPMHVAGLAIELSVPNSNWWRVTYEELARPARTTYFHFDESPAVPKSIVYLSDVTEKNGPTSIADFQLKNSHVTALQYLAGRIIGNVGRDETNPFKEEYQHKYHQTFGGKLFRQDFMRLPEEIQWNSHYGWDVVPDSELENKIIEAESKVTGDAGTFLVFDGARLLHRGGLMESGERIALQVIFMPIQKNYLHKRVINKLKRVAKKILNQ